MTAPKTTAAAGDECVYYENGRNPLAIVGLGLMLKFTLTAQEAQALQHALIAALAGKTEPLTPEQVQQIKKDLAEAPPSVDELLPPPVAPPPPDVTGKGQP